MTGSGSIRFGCDRVAEEPGRWVGAGRYAMLTNDAATLAADPTCTARVALQRAGVSLVRLFSPEHGLEARGADGAVIEDALDPRTSLPVHSLYGVTFAPERRLLDDLDGVIIDLPDVGARFYTYLWCAYHTLLACAAAQTPVIVLDRPNPIGGVLDHAEGPMLDPMQASYLGARVMPIRHSLTLGELMRLWRHERTPTADLRVVPCEGWVRSKLWPDTRLPFVRTSPAIANFASALCYPGTCLFEATNISVGRGTPWPFQWLGSPWLRSTEALSVLADAARAGVQFSTQRCSPDMAPYAGTSCNGVQWTVTDAHAIRPVATSLLVIGIIAQLHADHFRWARYPTAANPSGEEHFERLVGRQGIREALMAGVPSPKTLKAWTSIDDWKGRVAPHLLYE
ncbi:MAG: DUF1343 domain-containing protein [Gemmatimonadaceae bacterium]